MTKADEKALLEGLEAIRDILDQHNKSIAMLKEILENHEKRLRAKEAKYD